MIWAAIKDTKKSKEDLNLVWLDLANAYGSVLHEVIDFAMAQFWVPECLREVVRKHYDRFKMWSTTCSFTTSWQNLAVGIPTRCAISPLLFILAMEVVVSGAEGVVKKIPVVTNRVLLPMGAFKDDITILIS